MLGGRLSSILSSFAVRPLIALTDDPRSWCEVGVLRPLVAPLPELILEGVSRPPDPCDADILESEKSLSVYDQRLPDLLNEHVLMGRGYKSYKTSTILIHNAIIYLINLFVQVNTWIMASHFNIK